MAYAPDDVVDKARKNLGELRNKLDQAIQNRRPENEIESLMNEVYFASRLVEEMVYG